MLKRIAFIFLVYIPIIVSGQKYNEQTGKASFYSDEFNGRTTASGEQYNPRELTAAHLTLPFNTKVKVINLENDKSVTVRINDRGPFIKGRIIDLSKAAAKKLDFQDQGVTRVKLIPLVNQGEEAQNQAEEAQKNKSHTKEKNAPDKRHKKPESKPNSAAVIKNSIAEKEYSIELQAKRYIELYEKILEDNYVKSGT